MTLHWTDALAQHWGIQARLTQLAGEYDLNFLAETLAGEGYILKVMRPGCNRELIEMQVSALAHVHDQPLADLYPEVIATQQGVACVSCLDTDGKPRLLWLLSRLPGRSYAQSAPKTRALAGDLGRAVGATDRVFETFRHPALERDFKWHMMQALWIKPELGVISDPDRRRLLQDIVADFSGVLGQLQNLPTQAVHNDINDYNILVSDEFCAPRRITGLIDLGDMCIAPRICDLAIAAAYVVLERSDPEEALEAFVAGYHAENPLLSVELYVLWPLLQMRLAVSVVNSTLMAQAHPDDPYVVISQAPAW